MKSEYLQGRFKAFQTEVDSSGVIWREGERCPVKVAGISCMGILKLEAVGDQLELQCNQDPMHHSVNVDSPSLS